MESESAYVNGNNKLVAASALDFLLIEIVPLAQNVVQQLLQDSDGSDTTTTTTTAPNEDDVYYRIEGYGYRVGLGLSQIFTKERLYFTNPLDIMKFVCKELWVVLYKKQIDNLKTNHRGTYVLTDNQFKYCSRMGTAYGPQETIRRATPYLWFPAGVIRGTLSALGIDSTVTFDAEQLPKVTFNIQTSSN